MYTVPYECIKKICDWTIGVENIDRGDYATTDGNCESCMYTCSINESCEAVECGDGYCRWWNNGKCNEAHELTQTSDGFVLTCLKDGKGTHS